MSVTINETACVVSPNNTNINIFIEETVCKVSTEETDVIVSIETVSIIVIPEEVDINVVVEETPITVEVQEGFYGNASHIKGVSVSDTLPVEGEALVYTDGEYVPSSVSSSSSGKVEQTYEAGETLSGHRLIEIRDNLAYYTDYENIIFGRKIGLTQSAISIGASGSILFFGEIENASWNFDLTKPVFLGSSGNLTQIKPSSGYLLVIGKPIQINKLFLDIQNPIKLT